MMDEIEFLFDCVKDGRLSKEQAGEIILNKKSSSAASSQKGATFAPGFSKHHCNNCEDSRKSAAGEQLVHYS